MVLAVAHQVLVTPDQDEAVPHQVQAPVLVHADGVDQSLVVPLEVAGVLVELTAWRPTRL